MGGEDVRKAMYAFAYNGHEGGEAEQVGRQLVWLREVFSDRPTDDRSGQP